MDDLIRQYIGPPLHEIFQSGLGLNEEQTEEGVYYFREYYGSKGLYENLLYPGIDKLLGKLKQQGAEIHLATSKLEKYALQILEFHEIRKYFSVIAGAAYKGAGADKSYLISQVLQRREQLPHDKFLMVGDTPYDILGAKSAGIVSIGVLYGFGTEQELNSAGANYLISTVGELECFFMKSD
jgi:phosphoglycolate phosphatase